MEPAVRKSKEGISGEVPPPPLPDIVTLEAAARLFGPL